MPADLPIVAIPWTVARASGVIVKIPRRAISLIQPWPWLMLHLPPKHRKDLENRSRRMGLESAGDVWVHASKREPEEERDAAIACALEMGVPRNLLARMPTELPHGGIVGRWRFTGEIFRPLSGQPTLPGLEGRRWHMPDQYGAVVDNAEPVDFVPCSGARGLWRVTDEVLALLVEQERKRR